VVAEEVEDLWMSNKNNSNNIVVEEEDVVGDKETLILISIVYHKIGNLRVIGIGIRRMMIMLLIILDLIKIAMRLSETVMMAYIR
jgi:hypothetical protein